MPRAREHARVVLVGLDRVRDPEALGVAGHRARSLDARLPRVPPDLDRPRRARAGRQGLALGDREGVPTLLPVLEPVLDDPERPEEREVNRRLPPAARRVVHEPAAAVRGTEQLDCERRRRLRLVEWMQLPIVRLQPPAGQHEPRLAAREDRQRDRSR